MRRSTSATNQEHLSGEQEQWVLPAPPVDTAATAVVSHAGGVLLTETARTVGLDHALSAALGRWRRPLAVHDPAKVGGDLAVTVAVGGDRLADIAVLRAEPRVYGQVASDPTVSRTIDPHQPGRPGRPGRRGRTGAAGDAGDVVLTPAEDTAYARLATRMNTIWALGNPSTASPTDPPPPTRPPPTSLDQQGSPDHGHHRPAARRAATRHPPGRSRAPGQRGCRRRGGRRRAHRAGAVDPARGHPPRVTLATTEQAAATLRRPATSPGALRTACRPRDRACLVWRKSLRG